MKYQKLTIDTWNELDVSGNIVSGYKGIWLAKNDNESSNLHLFKDETGKYHYVIEINDSKNIEIDNPEVNGLDIDINKYRLVKDSIKTFIDIKCSMTGFLQEFTEVVKEISHAILEENKQPEDAVNLIVRNWKQFWANQNKKLLTEEQQIGLICEIKVLEELCKVNSANALNSWIGPLGQKHDFNFTEWCFEVKGTRQSSHSHTINGIDQLEIPEKKSLGFISFLIINSGSDDAINLQGVIEHITEKKLLDRPDLIIKFNELLASSGYSPVFKEEYRKYKIDILECILYNVDASFPTLTTSKLIEPLDTRITSVRYNVSLIGISGKKMNEINWGDYFY